MYQYSFLALIQLNKTKQLSQNADKNRGFLFCCLHSYQLYFFIENITSKLHTPELNLLVCLVSFLHFSDVYKGEKDL